MAQPDPLSRMRAEALASADSVAALLALESGRVAAMARAMLALERVQLVTLARGSSQNAALHFGTLLARLTGRLCLPLPLSWVTLYQLDIESTPVWPVAFSQSGGSPDLRAALQHCDPQRRHSSAFVNTWPSPLADAASHGIALHAAPETAVAATKSVIAQMTAGAMLSAALAAPASAAAADLQLELQQLPQWLRSAQQADPEPLVQALAGCRHLYVIGRGQGLPIARELALKFKETCGLQAEAFSAAELQHGPLALAGPDLHALVLVTDRQSAPELLACAERLDRLQARVRLAGPCPGSLFDLPPLPGTYCPGVAYLGGLYLLVDALARRLGRDPDRPPHLNKVTLTF